MSVFTKKDRPPLEYRANIKRVSNGYVVEYFEAKWTSGEVSLFRLFGQGDSEPRDYQKTMTVVFNLICDVHEFLDSYFTADAHGLIEASKEEKR